MVSASQSAGHGEHGRLAAIWLTAAILAGCARSQASEALAGTDPPALVASAVQLSPTTTVQPAFQATLQPTLQPEATQPLLEPGLDLLAGPVEVPLELRIPALRVNAPMVGVGITPENVMDAPRGPVGDPLWQSAFWYRGSGIPGDSGTAAIAGHVNDPLGRPAIFARLADLLPGDVIIVHDTRSGLDLTFVVTETKVYSVQESADPAVLAQIYGAGPASGRGPEPSPDGLAHLTLITCAGLIVGGSFDHHVVVYATRMQ